jgi:hypothetical protein
MLSPTHLVALAYQLGRDPRGAAESAIDAWVREASPRDVVRLGVTARAAFRHGVWSTYVPLNAPLVPERLAEIAPRAPTSVAALLSTHRSGYVRELALRHLAAARDAFVIPFLLLRTDDIVPELRALAEGAIEARLEPELAAPFARSLAMLETLGGRTRSGGGPMARRIHRFLAQPACRQALVAASSDPDPAVRRLASSLRLHVEPAAHVLAPALRDPDTRVRIWAARASVSRSTSDDDKCALLPILQASRSACTRSLALRASQRLDGGDGPLEAALLDHHAAVRYLARTLLRARHPDRAFGQARTGALAVLATAGAPGPELVGALGALADVGLPEDGDAVARFLADPRPRVRLEATRTLGFVRR